MKTDFIKLSKHEFFSKIDLSSNHEVESIEFSKSVLIKNIRPDNDLNLRTVDSQVRIKTGSYYIPEDIIIKEDGELEIEEGTHLYFAKGKGIVSFGKVYANGSEDNMILISGDEWANVSFIEEYSTGSYLYNTIIIDGHGRQKIPFGDDTFMNDNKFYMGGNLYIERSHVRIRSIILHNGYSDIGGGLFTFFSLVDLEDSIIMNNECKATGGGGITCEGSKINLDKKPSRIRNCYILANKSWETGGLDISCGVIILDELFIKHNYSELSCAGLKITNYDINKTSFDHRGNIRLINSTIEYNVGFTSGGLYCLNRDLDPEDFLTNTIKNNTARYGDKHNIG